MKFRHSSYKKRVALKKRQSIKCMTAKTERKKKRMKQQEEKFGFFFKDRVCKPLCELKLFICLMCGIITPLTLSVILI